jgi:hypothetical protein
MPMPCDFHVIEHLHVDEIERRYIELYRAGRHGELPGFGTFARLRGVAW